MPADLHKAMSNAAATPHVPLDIGRLYQRGRRRRRRQYAITAASSILAIALVAGTALQLRPQTDVVLRGAADSGGAGESEAMADERTTDAQSGSREPFGGRLIHEFDLAGTAMVLLAHRSGSDLCVETQNAEPPHDPGSACGFAVPEMESVGLATWEAEDGVVLYGPVSRKVARVKVRLVDGATVEAGPFGRDAGFKVNFFVAALPANVQAKVVVATDADGRIIERDRVRAGR